jgi:hypothetical protein
LSFNEPLLYVKFDGRHTTVPTVPPVFYAFFSFSFVGKGREEKKEKEN